LGERAWLKYSTGLLMHDLLLILTSKLNILIMQTLKNENYFLVFCITILLEEAQNKIRQSRNQDDLFINDENT